MYKYSDQLNTSTQLQMSDKTQMTTAGVYFKGQFISNEFIQLIKSKY